MKKNNKILIFTLIFSMIYSTIHFEQSWAWGDSNSKEPFEFKKEEKSFNEASFKDLLKKEPMFLEIESKFLKADYFKQTLNLQYSSSEKYIYYGEIKDNKPNGKGLLIRSTFNDLGKYVFCPYYYGNFKDGRFNRYGKLYEKASVFYQKFDGGEWSALDEIGVSYLKYSGYFSGGQFSGKGNYYRIIEQIALDNSSGSMGYSYISNYDKKNSQLIKKSIESFSNSSDSIIISDMPLMDTYISYSSEFKKGMMNGKGKEYDINNNLIYIGTFKNDEYNGSGKLYSKGKIVYDGKWKNGEYNGKGTLYNEDGSVKYKGKWKNGEVD